MFNSVDRFLQLLVQYSTVRDDDYFVEYLFVIAVVEVREAMREPCKSERFARTGRVLHQVGSPCAFALGAHFEFVHGVPLVEAREHGRAV